MLQNSQNTAFATNEQLIQQAGEFVAPQYQQGGLRAGE